jgi:hypothetical protein
MSSPFAESVWEGISEQYGVVGDPSRAHYQGVLDHYEGLGMPVPVAVELVAEQIQKSRRVIDAGLDAFGGLVASSEVAGLALEGQAEPELLMRHLLETKLKIAKLYHFISTIALEADISDVSPPSETATMVAESEAQLEQWLSRKE